MAIKDIGYRFCGFDDVSPDQPDIIMRHDIDLSLAHALRLAELEAKENIRANYYMMVEISQFLEAHGNGIAIDFERRETLVYEIPKFISNRQNYAMNREIYENMWEEYSWETQKRRLQAIYGGLGRAKRPPRG